MTTTNYEGVTIGAHLSYVTHIFSALAGDASNIGSAFVWSETPQGHAHWSAIQQGDADLDDEDIAYLRGLIRYIIEQLIEQPRRVKYVSEEEFYAAEEYAADLEDY